VLVSVCVATWLTELESDGNQYLSFFSDLGLNPNNGLTTPTLWARVLATSAVVIVAIATQFTQVSRALRLSALVVAVLGVLAIAVASTFVIASNHWQIGWGVPTYALGLIVLGIVLVRPRMPFGTTKLSA
jgi:hypothetical protein